MNKLSNPQITAQVAFLACTSGLRDKDLKDRLEECVPHINLAEDDYLNRAKMGALYSFLPLISTNNSNQNIINNVSKDDLNDLYENGMVKRKSGRNIYDTILVAAQEICPFCGGIGRPATLDHYLPKANFPLFSVLPVNLVPCCRDCNSGEKGVQFATNPEIQILHPYFENDHFYAQQWVFARVVPTYPCVLEFYIEPPECWDSISKSRTATHFKNFDLAKRYSIQAANEFSTLIGQQSTYFRGRSSEDFKEHLLSCVDATLPVNYWRNVMYGSLAKDDWFCERQLQL